MRERCGATVSIGENQEAEGDWRNGPVTCGPVSKTVRSELMKILKGAWGAFARDEMDFGLITGVEFEVGLKEDVRPFYAKPYPTTPTAKEKIEQITAKWIRADVCEPIRYSEWASPVALAAKKDGSARMYVDVRGSTK